VPEPAGSPGSPASILILASPDMSNESLYATRAFAHEVLPGARVVAGSLKPPGEEDEILRRADLHPNRKGCEILGLWTDDVRSELSRGGATLVIVQNDLVDHDPGATELLARFETVICFATNLNETSARARLVHPVAPHSESDGTFTNFQGRVQRFRKGVTPHGDALSVMELWKRIASQLGVEFGWVSVNHVWKEMAETVPDFEGMSPSAIGDSGMLLKRSRGSAPATEPAGRS
jgi:NADH-quinone oxidoreductase subunit G